MAAAQAMARGEREGISPLVVHGPSGVGKSRLLAGLVAERLRRQPGSSVAHLDAQAFAAACLEAAGTAAGAGWSALRGRFRCVDLFVLEDLEGLERAPLARDELAHTLDALEAAGAAVAVSARSAPGTWPRLEWSVRLVNRLLGGLVVRIAPPVLASRRRYVLAACCSARRGAAGRGRRDARPSRRRLPSPRRLDRPAGLGRPAQSRTRERGRGSGSGRAARRSTSASATRAGCARSAHGRHDLG